MFPGQQYTARSLSEPAGWLMFHHKCVLHVADNPAMERSITLIDLKYLILRRKRTPSFWQSAQCRPESLVVTNDGLLTWCGVNWVHNSSGHGIWFQCYALVGDGVVQVLYHFQHFVWVIDQPDQAANNTERCTFWMKYSRRSMLKCISACPPYYWCVYMSMNMPVTRTPHPIMLRTIQTNCTTRHYEVNLKLVWTVPDLWWTWSGLLRL